MNFGLSKNLVFSLGIISQNLTKICQNYIFLYFRKCGFLTDSIKQNNIEYTTFSFTTLGYSNLSSRVKRTSKNEFDGDCRLLNL